MGIFAKLFSSDGFMPHGHCYLWEPPLVWLHVISDSLIALAYFTIPVTLIIIARKRKDLPFDWIFLCFGTFILACGITHLLEVWTLWHATYWLSGAMKALTAAVSVATAILLVKLIPRLLAIPSPTTLLIANRALEKEIDERNRAEAALEKTHGELVEASRQAGMAEVATGVLHNVGNVLNSVNVASTCVADSLRRSKAANLPKVVALLREHEGDLGAFFTGDPRGRQLPGYLARLAEHLTTEQTAALEELAQLEKNIQHIREIVTMQQGSAKASAATEAVNVAELVEDALKMNSSSFAHRALPFSTEFADVQPVMVEKHRALQILVNLLRNAQQSCDESNLPEKLLAVRVTPGDGSVRIAVTDNGIGIPPENLARIFTHGFTTKKSGHGFGLHSAWLAANEMGGSLTVHSDGTGHGATFTLDLPCNAGEEAHE